MNSTIKQSKEGLKESMISMCNNLINMVFRNRDEIESLKRKLLKKESLSYSSPITLEKDEWIKQLDEVKIQIEKIINDIESDFKSDADSDDEYYESEDDELSKLKDAYKSLDDINYETIMLGDLKDVLLSVVKNLNWIISKTDPKIAIYMNWFQDDQLENEQNKTRNMLRILNEQKYKILDIILFQINKQLMLRKDSGGRCRNESL